MSEQAAEPLPSPAPLPPANKLRLWKCWNADCMDVPPRPGHDFIHETGVCDKCGCHPKHPRAGHLITPRVVIHFMADGVQSSDLPNAKSKLIRGIGSGLIACTGKKRMTELYTGSTAATTCPYCQLTDEFKAAAFDLEVPPEHQLPVNVDVKKGLIVTSTGGCG